MAAELPAGTVTFLFTDLESSTRLWEQHPEAMKAALARHDEILRDAIEGRGGRVAKSTGDGLHGVFGTAEDALRAAAAGQVALAALRVDGEQVMTVPSLALPEDTPSPDDAAIPTGRANCSPTIPTIPYS